MSNKHVSKPKQIWLENAHILLQVDEQRLLRVVEALLMEEGQQSRTVSIALVDDGHIQKLNREYLDCDHPTDVLSFPMDQLEDRDEGESVLGDIYVSLDRAWEQSREYGVPFEEEVARLVFHGLLHLLGYDDRDEMDRSIMFERQEAYVDCFKGAKNRV